MDPDDNTPNDPQLSRRSLLKAGVALAAVPSLSHAQPAPQSTPADVAASLPQASSADVRPVTTRIRLRVNGRSQPLIVDTRTTLLDALREQLGMKGTKKGCDHGQCGACTVLVEGRRVNSCLTLAVMADGDSITTIEGLAHGDTLHPMQAAFVAHDGFQCGFCTSGQICSSIGMLAEARAGMPSHVSADLTARVSLTDEEIRERMSGNLCRCSAYPNIVAAIREVGSSS